jgi:hypothetical protein
MYSVVDIEYQLIIFVYSTAPCSAKAASSPPTISANTPNGERAMRFGIARA